jgi:hypothetical protein
MTRLCAVAAPLLLLLYGFFRYLDGLDGHRGSGPYWTVGHIFFLVSMVLLAVLMVGLRGLVTRLRPLATGAAVAAILGICGFLWSVLGDLFDGFPSLAGPLRAVTPALFQIGALVLLVQLAVARRVPFWTPVLMLVGFSLIGIDLDLLPLGAVVVFIGLLPLARRSGGLPVDEGRSAVPR